MDEGELRLIRTAQAHAHRPLSASLPAVVEEMHDTVLLGTRFTGTGPAG